MGTGDLGGGSDEHFYLNIYCSDRSVLQNVSMLFITIRCGEEVLWWETRYDIFAQTFHRQNLKDDISGVGAEFLVIPSWG